MERDDRLHDVHAVGDGRRDSSPPPSAAVAASQVLIAETLRETLIEEHREHATTYEHIAARIGGKKQHVSEMCDPLSGRVLSLVKTVQLGPRTAPALLRRLAAKIEAAAGAKVDLCRAALGVMGNAGAMASAVDAAIADGVVTEAEERAVETALLSIEAKVAAVRVSLRQHRDRRGAR